MTRPICGLLRSDLELYAEGELHDTERLRAVRRHVAHCAACRDRLREHDELTAAILAGPPSDSLLGASRADGIFESIRAAPPPIPLGRGGWGAFASMASLAAAAAIVVCAVLAPPSPSGPDGRAGSEPSLEPTPPLTGNELATDLPAPEPPRRASASNDADGRLRWVLDTGVDASGAGLSPAGSLLRLYGFRGTSEGLFSGGKEAEWVVDAAASGSAAAQDASRPSARAAGGEKYFLVPDEPEGAQRAPIQIEPVQWSSSDRILAPITAGGRGQAAPVFRVYVVPGLRALHVIAPPPPVDPAFFPSLHGEPRKAMPVTYFRW